MKGPPEGAHPGGRGQWQRGRAHRRAAEEGQGREGTAGQRRGGRLKEAEGWPTRSTRARRPMSERPAEGAEGPSHLGGPRRAGSRRTQVAPFLPPMVTPATASRRLPHVVCIVIRNFTRPPDHPPQSSTRPPSPQPIGDRTGTVKPPALTSNPFVETSFGPSQNRCTRPPAFLGGAVQDLF